MEVLLSVASGADGNGQRSTTRRHAITRDLTRISIVAAGTLWWYVLAAQKILLLNVVLGSELRLSQRRPRLRRPWHLSRLAGCLP